jgi:hypothetical protein
MWLRIIVISVAQNLTLALYVLRVAEYQAPFPVKITHFAGGWYFNPSVYIQ